MFLVFSLGLYSFPAIETSTNPDLALANTVASSIVSSIAILYFPSLILVADLSFTFNASKLVLSDCLYIHILGLFRFLPL